MIDSTRKRSSYRFTITFQTPEITKVCDFMEKLDLNMGHICIQQIFTFNAYDMPIEKMKEHIRKVMNHCDCRLFEIEGVKIP